MGGADGESGRESGLAVCKVVSIVNQRGLHARAAARFVQMAAKFDADVTVVKNDIEVSGLSIMGLMMLAAGPGTELEIRAQGPDAEEAVDALDALVANRFDEE